MTLYNPCTNQVQLDTSSLVQIFSFLETKDKQNAAQVCQYWRDVVYIPSLWTNVRVVLHNKLRVRLLRSLCQRGIHRFVCRGSTDQDLALLFKTNCHITSLKINGCRNVTQQFLQNNLGKLNDLVSLHIAQCKQVNVISLYSETSLDDVLARLKSITIPKRQDFSNLKLQEILKKCPSLEEIDYGGELTMNFSRCPGLLSTSCPKLQHLKLSSDLFISSYWSMYKDGWKATLSILNLKVLDLELCSLKDDISEVADIFYNLESLSLSIKGNIFAVSTLSCLFKNNPNLKHFAIDIERFNYYLEEDGEEINEKALSCEICKLRKLESLRISFPAGILSGEVIYNVVEGLPNLKQLELGEVGSISAEYADLIGDQLPKLRSLKIISKEKNISGIGILCSKLPSLTDLTIKHDDGLLNRDVIQMSTNARCSGLKSLNIAGSKKIKDDGIKCIANTFKSLTSLDASSCSLSDSGLVVITEQLNCLQKLRVTGKKITNYGAIMIGKHLKGLEHLKISGTKIGDQGFAFICSQLPRLQTLEAICKLVTDQGFQEGAQWLGGLTTLRIGSHGIHMKEFLESAKHLKSVVELTIRSISIDQHFVNRIIRQMPCLSNFSIYCCSPSSRYSRSYFLERRKKHNKVCQTNGVTSRSYTYPCREHAYDTREGLYRRRLLFRCSRRRSRSRSSLSPQ